MIIVHVALPLTIFYVGESVLCLTTNPLTKLISMWFSFLPLELPCYITLLCGVEQLSSLISEGETMSVIYLW